jgi:hypothetical protein
MPQIISEKKITVDKYCAYQLIYKGKDGNGVTWQYRNIFIIKKGCLYTISCLTLPEDFNNSQANFDLIIKSFHVK